MNKELLEALNILEKEKEISKEVMFETIENSLLAACKNHFGKADNVKVEINRETGDFLVYAIKEVVETPFFTLLMKVLFLLTTDDCVGFSDSLVQFL